MYRIFWKVLPGPVWVRLVIVSVAVAGVGAACVLWLFPAIDQLTGGASSGVIITPPTPTSGFTRPPLGG